MGIETCCTGCGQMLRVGDEHAGRQARCPQCGQIYTVPGQSESAQEQWWMLAAEGNQYGPVSREELDHWFKQGRIALEAQLKSDSQPEWQPAVLVYPALADMPQRAEEPRAEVNPFQTPVTTSRRFWRPHRGANVLILGVLSLVCCQILGPFAWIMGHTDLSAIDRGTMDPSGRGLTQAGMVLGIISTVLLILQSGIFSLGAVFQVFD